jgi:hypothetical protein
MDAAFSMAIRRAAGMGDFVADGRLVAELEAFDVADDGSAQWQYVVYLIGRSHRDVHAGPASGQVFAGHVQGLR